MPKLDDELVTTSISIPQNLKNRLEDAARSQDLNTSQLLRRILRDYFEAIDAENKTPVNLEEELLRR